MAALSANAASVRDKRADKAKAFFEVENSETLYRQSIGSLRTPGNATAGNQGRVGAYTGAAGELAVGEYGGLKSPIIGAGYAAAPTEEVVGDTSAAEIPKAGLPIEPQIFKRQTVTGVSAIANVTRLVYLADDNGWTLTPQTRPDPVAYVIERHADDTADIFFFGPSLRLAGARIERLQVTAVAVDMTQQSADLVAAYPMPYAGLVLAVGFQAVTAITGSPTTVINAEFGTTNLTGGTVTNVATSVNGVVVGSTFASADHFFSRGTALSIEIDGGTAASGGTAHLFVDVIVLPGT